MRRYEQIRKEKAEKKQNVYNEMLQWLETHDGEDPRFQITRDGKRLKSKDMTFEEKKERSLVSRWYSSKEYKAFKACKGIPLENLSAEYEAYREQIATLRRYEQIRKEKAQKKQNVYNEMLQWLETHDGIYPRGIITKDGKVLKVAEMLQEEREEKNLYSRWKRSKECKAFKACEGIQLEELPAEYEAYREQIATLRRYEQIRKEKAQKKQNVYNEMLQWLETHDGIYPRGIITKDGKVLKVAEMLQEEREEKNLYSRWKRSKECKAFKACEGIQLEELPAEYEAYREQIATLRRCEQIRKEKAVKKRMRRSVAKQVKNNASTRSELQGIVIQLEDNTLEEK